MMLTCAKRCLAVQAAWVQFSPDPAVADPYSWAMSKLGSHISPLDVVINGSHSMHAVDDEGVFVSGYGLQRSWEQLNIRYFAHHTLEPSSAETCA